MQALPCGHVLHEQCVTDMRRRGASGRCPHCREAHTDLTPVQTLIDKAALCARRREFEESFRLYSEVLSIDPVNADANACLGDHFYNGLGVKKDNVRAIELYEQARLEDHAGASYNLGVIYDDQGDTKHAMDMYKDARRQSKSLGHAGATHNLGVLYKQNGDKTKAEALFQEAWAMGYALAARSFGLLYEEDGATQKAKEFFEEAWRAGDVASANNLGCIYDGLGDTQKAMEMYEVSRRYGNSKATRNLGILHQQHGDLRKAQDLFEEARFLGSADDRVKAVVSLIKLLVERGGYEEKVQELSEEARRTGGADGAFMLGCLYDELGDTSNALEMYEEARHQGHAGASFNLSVYCSEQGNVEKQKELLEEARLRGHERATFNLGAIHQQMGDMKNAKLFWEEARRNGDAAAAFDLGICFRNEGNTSKAKKLFEEAWRLGHENAVSEFGVLHEQQGQTQKARELYEEGWRNGNVGATCNLGVLSRKEGDFKKAEELFEQARLQGSLDAVLNLGCLFLEQGALRKSRLLLEEARRRGHAGAMLPLKWLSDLGVHVVHERVAELNSEHITYCTGDRVKVLGLMSTAGQPLNGRIGTVVRRDRRTGRYGVKFDSDEDVKAIRVENLRHHTTQSPPADTSSLVSGSAEVGSLVSFSGDSAHSLTGDASQLLIGRIGTSSGVGQDTPTGSSGVKFKDEEATKAAREDSRSVVPAQAPLASASDTSTQERTDLFVTSLSMHPAMAFLTEPTGLHIEDYLDQPAIECSLRNAREAAVTWQGESDVNAQVSDALVRSPALNGPRVVLLTFTRSPRAFREALLEATGELAECRRALDEAGLAVEHVSGAKMLVQPWQYEPALEALRLCKLTLLHQHVVVDPSLADSVESLVRGLPRRNKVYMRDTNVLPLGSAAAIGQMDVPVSVSKTFIDIRVPSSLCSTISLGPRTVSTTDANPRKGPNPRS